MKKRIKTSDKIIEAARKRFNKQGYSATTLNEIAADVGISQGNLTYHFRTKRDLVTGIQALVGARIDARRARPQPSSLAAVYVEHLLFGMELTSTYRFLLRDDAQLGEGPDHQRPHGVLVHDFAHLRGLIDRIDEEGWFLSELDVDLDVLSRSLWIMGRYWMDYLMEMELIDEASIEDQRRGVEHHFSLLLPNLVPEARHLFSQALAEATEGG